MVRFPVAIGSRMPGNANLCEVNVSREYTDQSGSAMLLCVAPGGFRDNIKMSSKRPHILCDARALARR